MERSEEIPVRQVAPVNTTRFKVARSERVADVPADDRGEVEAARREIGQRVASGGTLPVDDTADLLVVPEHVAGPVIAVQQPFVVVQS